VRISLDLQPDTCDELTAVSSYTWMLVLTILCALTSFVLELFYVLETFKIVRELKNMFQKHKTGEADTSNKAAVMHHEKL
jgi:hypothetical protein